MSRTFFVLFSFISLFQSSVCSTIEVTRNAGSTGGDEIENKGCRGETCTKHGLVCGGNGCCKCDCPFSEPNYVVSKGVCKTREEFKRELNADCEYGFAQSSKPFADFPLTSQASGSGTFSTGRLEVICDHNIQAGQWHYLDAFGKWQIGDQDVFNVSYNPILIGQPKNDYRIEALKWFSTLNAKYAGVIIKVSLTCGNNNIGCTIVKVSGSKRYDLTEAGTTTQAPLPTTTPNVPTVTQQVITSGQNDSFAPQSANNDRSGSNDNSSDPSAALIPALAVFGALILALGIAAFIFYRRRQKRRDPEAGAFANPDYNEPIYAEVNKEAFENPVYSDPALDAGNRRSQLGPLPHIPGTESPYQPLDNTTRKQEDDDAIDYENPIDGTPPGADYDNPPINSKTESSSDYDNPPVQGAQEKSSDYDNPPPVEGEDSENNEYKVPKSDVVSNEEGQDSEITAF